MEDDVIDLRAQAEALATQRGLNYQDLQSQYSDDEIVEAFGELPTGPARFEDPSYRPLRLSVGDGDAEVLGMPPAAAPATPSATPPAPAPAPAAAPVAEVVVAEEGAEPESLPAQAQRVLQEQRPDLDYRSLRRQGYTDNEIIAAFRPGPTVAAAQTMADFRLDEDFDALRRLGAGAREIAQFGAEKTAPATGQTYADYVRMGLSDDDIIARTFNDESVVQRRNPYLFSVARNTMKSSPVMLGATAGGMTGVAVGGPYAPLTGLIGAIIGGIAGAPAGEALAESAMGPDTPVVPGQELASRAGRFVGETLPFFFVPHVAAARTPLPELAMLRYRAEQGRALPDTPGVTPWDTLRIMAGYRPGAVTGTEAVSTGAGALAAAGTQQSYFPGQPESIVPDLAGAGVGALLPARAVTEGVLNLADTAIRTLSNVASTTETRTVNLFADVVMDMYAQSGRDPQATLDRLATTPLADLAEQYGVDVGPIGTIIRAGDDPVMRDLIGALQNVSGTLGPTRARAQQTSMLRNLEGLVKISRMMASTGDPELVRTAALLQEEAFGAGLQMTFDAYLAQAAGTAKNILITDPLASQRASIVVGNAIDNAVEVANRQRERLYDRVDNAAPAPGGVSNLAALASEIRGELRSVRNINSFAPKLDALQRDIDGLISAQAAGEEITVGDVRRIRTTMLDNMRAAGAGANPDPTAQRYWGQLAEAVIDDLMFRPEQAFAGTDPAILNMLSANDRALLEANQFNVAFYDVFGRAFPEEILRDAASGARRIPVELIAERLKAGSGDATDIRYRQLDDAVTLVSRLYPSEETTAAGEKGLRTLRGAQDRMLRLLASRVVDLTDPDNPRVNNEALQRLMRSDNPSGFGPALERFPDLKADLNNAITAENLLLDVVQQNTDAAEARASQRWLQRLLKIDPGEAVGAAIGSPGASRPFDEDAGFTGARDLGRIVNLAKRSEDPDLALRGVVDTVLDRGITYAGGDSGNMSFAEFRRFLTESLGGKTDSTLGVLRREGALTQEQEVNLRTLLREGEIIETALRSTTPDRDAVEALKAVSPVNLVLLGRFLGAREGARLQSLAGMNTIQIPGYFAQIGGQIAQRIPASRKLDLFARFVEDPKFAELVLRRGIDRQGERATVAEMRAMERALNGFQSYLTRAGLIPSAPLVTGEAGRTSDFEITLPQARAATPDTAELEAYLQSVQPPAPAPATPAAAPQPTPATPSAGAPPPAALPAGPPPAPRAGGSSGASYSALFPNDPISPMLQQREMQQGIGSLMAGPR
jgi:uncharacterized membrane protein